MVYITKKIDLQTYNDLKTKGSQALKDFGFECLYDSGYIKSDREYEVRFAIVMYLNYYTKTKYLKKIFKQIEQVKNDEYYVKMAIAWFVAEAYANNMEDTLEYIKNSKLDNWTFNKAIQKIRESYRVSKEDKEMLNKMKRK